MKEYITRREALIVLEEMEDIESGFAAMYEIPTADVTEVRHGRWLCVDTDTEQFFLCNRCKKKEYWESNYCPNCGAKMDKEEE